MKKILKIFIILILIPSCQSAKDAFTLQKKESTDEFLVEKKSPLVLPPEFGELPIPEGNKIKDDEKKNNEEVKILVTNNQMEDTSNSKKNSNPTSIENSVLEKIK